MTITTWARVEPSARSADLDAGLAAAVADPLWFLARQLVHGELSGDDGGTPVAVDVAASWTRFTRFRAGRAEGGAEPIRIDQDSGPIEALVEGEPTLALAADEGTPDRGWAAALRAGRALHRVLVAMGLAAFADQLAIDARTCFDPGQTPSVPDPPPEGPDEDRYRTLLAHRAIDGARVLKLHLAGSGLPASLTQDLNDADRTTLDAVVADWAAATADEWGIDRSTDGETPVSWLPERLEYAFALAAPPLPGDGEQELVFEANEYDGTGLSWYSLDLVEGASLGAAADGQTAAVDPANNQPATADLLERQTVARTPPRTMLPAGLRFPGMPATRFWEMEDASVSLGDIDAGPTDLARTVALDFAILHGSDWILALVEVPLGAVSRIDWVVVRDTFGVATLVGTSHDAAAAAQGMQYRPTVVGGDPGPTQLLVTLPPAMAALRSASVDEATFQRDEAANLAWGIERVVMGPVGRGIRTPWTSGEFEPTPTTTTEAHELVWHLATPVARSWIPFVPTEDGDGHWLGRGRMFDTPTEEIRDARSRVLREVERVRDEEITPAGARVAIIEQLARWPDGRTFVWRGRERHEASGEASSRLQFDAAPTDTPAPGSEPT